MCIISCIALLLRQLAICNHQTTLECAAHSTKAAVCALRRNHFHPAHRTMNNGPSRLAPTRNMHPEWSADAAMQRADPEEYAWVHSNMASDSPRLRDYFQRMGNLINRHYGPIVIPDEVRRLFS
jgi:hypothetical protein